MLLDDDLKVQLETKLVGQVITSITSEQSRSIAGSRLSFVANLDKVSVKIKFIIYILLLVVVQANSLMSHQIPHPRLKCQFLVRVMLVCLEWLIRPIRRQ